MNELSPKEQNIMMGFLKDYIDDLCYKCNLDRIENVFNPKCRKRFLINFRIMAGASIEELPRYCYEQVLNNLQKYILKKTTLYTPIDVLIYLSDFFKLFFPDISQGIIKKIRTKRVNEINTIINKSKIPAIYSKSRKEKPGILKNILKKDKLVKEGSFIYDYNENYFVIWYSNSLFIANLNTEIALCNAYNKKIEDLSIINMIIPLYAEGKEFNITLIQEQNSETKIKVTIQSKDLINLDGELKEKKFNELTEKLSPKFPRAIFNFTETSDLEIIVEVNKNCSYSDINFLFNEVSRLSQIVSINLLEGENE